jgi:hypothetical protein
MEHLVMLESRGGAPARFVLSRPGAAPLPLPVLEASEDLFRPVAVLHYGETVRLESCAPRFLAHVLDRAGDVPFGVRLEAVNQEHLDLVARRADVLAALLIRDDRATDAAGRTQTIEAWATQWKASADADLAFIGRSFAWWDRCRREGDGPALLAWFRDPLPPDAANSQDRTRLPALVVYSAR